MSKRLLASKVSKRGRMLRPRTSRPSIPGASSSFPPPSDASESLSGSDLPTAERADETAFDFSDAPPPVSGAAVSHAEVSNAAASELPVGSPPVSDAVGEELALHEQAGASEHDTTPPDSAASPPAEIAAAAAEPAVESSHADDVGFDIVPRQDTPEPEAVILREVIPAAREALVPPTQGKKKKKKGGGSVSVSPAAATSHVSIPVVAKSAVTIAEDDDHELSSHHFFSAPDSLTPVTDPEPELEITERVMPPTPESLAHRARLKKIVGGVLAAASLVALIGIGKSAFTSKSADAAQGSLGRGSDEAAHPAVTQTADPKKSEDDSRLADSKKADVKAAADAKTAAEKVAADVKADDDKKADEKKADDDKKADEKKADDAAADAKKADEEAKPAAVAATPDEIKALKKKAGIAINSGNNKNAIETANAAIAADPEDALMYLYLGSAYMNVGKSKDAAEAFNECVRKAKTGPKYECQQMGGHK